MRKEKFCPSCSETKALDAFTIRKSGRVGEPVTHCKPCRVAERKKKRVENREHFLHIERKSKFKRQYGISIEQYDSMLANQNNGCALCGTEKPSNRTKYFSVDHCHLTGKIRGLLCTKCNRGLGFFNDRPELLRAAAVYLTGG